MLDRREMRQLVQRVTARYHLAALTRDDTRAYISHRSVAGRRQSTSVHARRSARSIPTESRHSAADQRDRRSRAAGDVCRRSSAGHRADRSQGRARGLRTTGLVAPAPLDRRRRCDVALVIGGAWALWDHNPAVAVRAITTHRSRRDVRARRTLRSSTPEPKATGRERDPPRFPLEPARNPPVRHAEPEPTPLVTSAATAACDAAPTVDRLARPAGKSVRRICSAMHTQPCSIVGEHRFNRTTCRAIRRRRWDFSV